MNRLLSIFLFVDFLFFISGGMFVGLAVFWLTQRSGTPTQSTAANVLLLSGVPLTAMIANGALIAFTFVMSLPALALPTSVTWLRIHTWLVVSCIIYTTGLGLTIWLETLTTRANLGNTWVKHSADVQSLLQQEVSFLLPDLTYLTDS